MPAQPRKKDAEKTRRQLIEEIESLRERVSELEASQPAEAWSANAWLKNGLATSAAIDEMPDGVMLVDMGGKVIYVNKAFEKMMGYTAEELIGKPSLGLPTYRGSKDKARALEAL
jgi:PAS domain-containing protein